MRITSSSNVPDSTYFRTPDAAPSFGEGRIEILNGEGSRRSWGAPKVTSTAVVDEPDFAAIHVGFVHKHGGGQFWRYYTNDGGTIRRQTWAELSDETRLKVLDAKRPAWAKVPGKLRKNGVRSPVVRRTAYKLVAVDSEGLRSLFSGERYELGKRLSQAVGMRAGITEYGDTIHDGGYYSHETPEAVKVLWERGKLVPQDRAGAAEAVALLECEISGRIVEFPNGKLASTYIRPVRELERWAV